ncbi:MAG: hypothetical protein MUF07_15605 [Steroidobacteraceae bacterium]|jgi:hypothetical protein|nr:hypothetical protein [Steroidobacteraceae bacterium]
MYVSRCPFLAALATGLVLAVMLVFALTASPPAVAQSKAAAAARWDALTRQSPCDWLPPAVVASILGPDVKGQLRTTQADTGCSWRTARGNPMLTATLAKWNSAANMVAERDTLLQQIAQYGGAAFTRLPAPGGAATIVMRRDRGRITAFPTANDVVTVISINPHLVMKEDETQKEARRQRAIAFTAALVKQHGL